MPGGTVSMQCNFHPGGTVLWYKQESDGKMEFARDAQLIVSDNRYQIRSENGAYVLTINPTREEDSGQFMCHSSDMRGMIYEHTFLVTIGAGGGASRTTAAYVGTIAAALLLLI
ncbi:uncharacterized protein LOC119112621 [Pollicipes pollicipes]|nr:uncharacterized protein LOC119112621 [Pollicipes pollicipes]